MNPIQFLFQQLQLINIPEPDVETELPFDVVKNDCYKMVKSYFGIDLYNHNIDYHFFQEIAMFDLPNQVYFTHGWECNNKAILSVWHEVGHYVHSLFEDLEMVDPLYWESLPMLFEELCIKYYGLKCETYKATELRRYIALGLIDIELHQMKDVNQADFYSLIEHVQNAVGINVSVAMMEPIINTRYSGNYWGYVLSIIQAKQIINGEVYENYESV